MLYHLIFRVIIGVIRTQAIPAKVRVCQQVEHFDSHLAERVNANSIEIEPTNQSPYWKRPTTLPLAKQKKVKRNQTRACHRHIKSHNLALPSCEYLTFASPVTHRYSSRTRSTRTMYLPRHEAEGGRRFFFADRLEIRVRTAQKKKKKRNGSQDTDDAFIRAVKDTFFTSYGSISVLHGRI